MRISVKVISGACSEEVFERNGEIIVRVRAVREKGKANEAVLSLLAEKYGVARSAVRVVSGAAASRKIVEIVGNTSYGRDK